MVMMKEDQVVVGVNRSRDDEVIMTKEMMIKRENVV